MSRRALVHLWVTILSVAVCAGVAADGILIPPLRPIEEAPYFSIKYHHVKVSIEGQIATTYVDQVFVNETDREQEATYIFPLPPGAVVKDFTLIVDGKPMPGEILEREKAVAIYEEIVRKRKDPALLEYTGRNTYRARIYPIPGRGERRIELRYTELLGFDNGLVSYNYPMSTEKFSSKPIRETVFEASIRAEGKIGAVYSPSHEVDVSRKADGEVVVSHEETNSKPDRDMILHYSPAKQDVTTSVLTFKEKNEDGFFLLLASPSSEETTPAKAAPKSVIFVLDRSGSMAGEKIEQARKALEFCVNSLNPQDEFEILTFSSTVESLGGGLMPASKANIDKARKFVADITARGGTAMSEAFASAIRTRAEKHPNYIAVITDGLPTVGEVTDPDQIADDAKKQIAEKPLPTRVFTFGVGYDVDTHFLDRAADENGGVSTYVRPGEDIEVKVSNWYSKIAQPVLTGLELNFGTVKTYDSYPHELPDLFSGSQLAVFGRYKSETCGETTVTLTGKAGDGKRSFETQVTFPETRGNTEYLAPLWASRKIGFLLDQIRLHGKEKELVDEIVALSTKYGILTEYTAFLADEDAPITGPAGMAGAAPAAEAAMGLAFSRRGGGWATSQAQNSQRMRDSSNLAAQNRYLNEKGEEVAISNVQARGQRGFVNRGGQVQDLRYDPAKFGEPLKVQAYSEAYFQLSREFPVANQYLALSDNIVFILNGQAVQIGADGKTTLTAEDIENLRTVRG
ncbi:MAG: VWA domain-containing protein [Armatimonadetes bacterium]|jgi:Ca-activated chloride channel family protein|nr:VWA domain-containing protein [Armatimonadota bacterium]